MTSSKLWCGLGLIWCAACAHASGALGPQGYEQTMTQYRLNYSDATQKKFLPNDWILDNYVYDPSARKWTEKKGNEYRALRLLDEDGDGTISSSEKKMENVFDLRFVNSHDSAVIWLKVHPLQAGYASLDLDVILENYTDGLEGSGLFEQSTLFGLEMDKARHFTTFTVKKEAITLGALPAIRGVIEVADVEKLRLDSTHRDAKAELVFAKVAYLEDLGYTSPVTPRWPVISEMSADGIKHYKYRRIGLLIIGYCADATRFESHVADLHALLKQVEIPARAIPPDAVPVTIASHTQRADGNSEAHPSAVVPVPVAPATSAAPLTSATPAASASAESSTPPPVPLATTPAPAGAAAPATH